MAKLTLKRNGDCLTFNINGGQRKCRGMSLHIGTITLNLDKQYADMTMREIAEGLAEFMENKRGEIELVSMEFASRKESPKKGKCS